MNKLKFSIGVLSMALLLLMVACVKDVTDQQAQFQAEKAELLKAKAEMTTSFKAMADATRAVSKKNFSPSNRGARFDEQTLVNDLTQELVRQNPAIKADTKIRLNKVWNPKTEKLGDYLAANGASENVISYSNTLKTNLESASAKFSDDVKSGQLDTKEMLASVSQEIGRAHV